MLFLIKAAGFQEDFLKVWKVDRRGECKAQELQGTLGGIRESNWKQINKYTYKKMHRKTEMENKVEISGTITVMRK